MVPLVDFDDPEAMKERYRVLTTVGATPDAFGEVPRFMPEKTGGTQADAAEGVFHIPETASFFGDHFPRRPVFPGTLLMNLNLGFAIDLASEGIADASLWKPVA